MDKFKRRLAVFHHYRPLLSHEGYKIKVSKELPWIPVEYLESFNDYGDYGTCIFKHVSI